MASNTWVPTVTHILNCSYVFIARRYVSTVYAMAYVCLSVCPCTACDTSRCSIKTAKHHHVNDASIPETPVFWPERSWRNSNVVTQAVAKYRWSKLKYIRFWTNVSLCLRNVSGKGVTISELHAGPNFHIRPDPTHENRDPTRSDPLIFPASWTRPDPTRPNDYLWWAKRQVLPLFGLTRYMFLQYERIAICTQSPLYNLYQLLPETLHCDDWVPTNMYARNVRGVAVELSPMIRPWSCNKKVVITACTVVQAVVKATSQSNGKGQILTPRGSETPERISKKLGIYNRVAGMTTNANPCGAATTWVVWANTWKKHMLWFLRYYRNKYWLQFLFIVKATVLKQQMSEFYPQILSTEASNHIYFSQRPFKSVKAIFCA